MACENNDKIREAREQLDKIMADEELWDKIRLQESFELDQNTSLANARNEGIAEGKAEGRAEGLAEGLAEGEAKGKNEEKLVTAKKMLELGSDVEFIAQVTGLSVEEIEKLK